MEPYSNNVSLKKLLFSRGIITIIVITVILIGTFFIGIGGLGGKEAIPLPAASFKAEQPQHKGQIISSVAPPKVISAGVFTSASVSGNTLNPFSYSLSDGFSPLINTPSEGYPTSQMQWNWQHAAATLASNNINTGFAHLEQRIAADMFHMLKLVFAVGAVVIVVVVMSGGLAARYVTRRMVRNNLLPEVIDDNNPLCQVTQVEENIGSSGTTTASNRLATATNVTTVEQGSQLISDSEMTLEAILTAMQQMGDAVAEMAMSDWEQSGEATPWVRASKEIAPMGLQNTCETEHSTTDDTLADQALTLRRLMAFFASPEESFSEQDSAIKTRPAYPESETLTTAAAKKISSCSLH
jgi:hypothetical protein